MCRPEMLYPSICQNNTRLISYASFKIKILPTAISKNLKLWGKGKRRNQVITESPFNNTGCNNNNKTKKKKQKKWAWWWTWPQELKKFLDNCSWLYNWLTNEASIELRYKRCFSFVHTVLDGSSLTGRPWC